MAQQPRRRVKVFVKAGFKRSYDELRENEPAIQQKLTIFNHNKREIPPRDLPPNMQDHGLTGNLAGVRECHLGQDVLLLYTHKDDVVTLLRVCRHSDLHEMTARRLLRV